MYLDRLATACARFGVECLMFCLLGTHMHLLLRPERGDLAPLMHWLHGTYAKRFNRRHFRRGALFAARYDSVFVETDEHLLEVIRYVALNPVRAGASVCAEDWPWSSYASLIGLRRSEPFVANDEVLLVSTGTGAARSRRSATSSRAGSIARASLPDAYAPLVTSTGDQCQPATSGGSSPCSRP